MVVSDLPGFFWCFAVFSLGFFLRVSERFRCLFVLMCFLTWVDVYLLDSIDDPFFIRILPGGVGSQIGWL